MRLMGASLTFATLLLLAAGSAGAREEIRIVGSSTVFPFSASVAERFARQGNVAPVVESTGTGGGMKLFCSGTGPQHPDITNASRRIKLSEFEKCRDAGITIIEVKIGFDGIVLANALEGPSFNLTPQQVFMALAARVPIDGQLVHNPYYNWRDISRSLPNLPIEVLGPPPTSGTRDAFNEILMEAGAKSFPLLKQLRKRNKKSFKAVAHHLREDGVFIEAGENDNLIVQKLRANVGALGVFGFSFLDNNQTIIKGVPINGVAPEFDAIASGDYPVSRSLFFYVKKNHLGIIPGIEAFVRTFISDNASGEEGYLTDKGLIPLSGQARREAKREAETLAPLTLE